MRKFVIIGLGIVLLLIATAAVLPFLISAHVYEAKLIAAVKQATGRDLKIEGPVSLGLLTGLSLQAENVSLANVAGAPDAAMLTLAKLEVGLKLVPLLSGDVEITRLELTDPVVHLSVDKSGQGNWVFTPEAAPQPVPDKDATPTAKTASRIKELHLGTVKLTGGTLSYADLRSGAKQEVTKLDATLKLPSLDKTMQLDGSAVWRGQPVTVSLTLDKPNAIMGGTPQHVAFKLSAAPLRAEFDGTAAMKPAIKADGKLSLSTPSLSEAAGWAGSPPKAGGTGFGAASLDATLAFEGKSAKLSGLSFTLDQIKGHGEIGANLSNHVPEMQGTLALGALDLNPYLAHEKPGAASGPAQSEAPVAAPTTPGTGWSDAPINLSALKIADAKLALSFDSLAFRKIAIGKGQVAIDLQGGRLAIDIGQTALYGGLGKGRIGLDGTSGVGAGGIGLTADVAMSGIAIQPVLGAVMGVDRLSGTGAFNLKIASHGRSQRDLVAGLGGNGALSLANGAIKGVDFARLANEIQALTGKGGASGTASNGGDTAFTTMTGSFSISGGTLSNQDLAMASPLFKLTGKGTASLPQRTLDYRMEPTLSGAIQGSKIGILGTSVPILVQGPWDHLTYRPDLQAVLQDKLKGKLPGAVQGLLGGSQGAASGKSQKAGDLLKGFFGK